MAVYPNPTQNMLNVIAPCMNHITVMNTVGQVLYDTDAESDQFVLDMSQYESGMYLVRVSTDSGTIVKRINVVR